MDIDGNLHVGPDGFADHWPDGEIGNVMVIHHIKVNEICPCRLNTADFLA